MNTGIILCFQLDNGGGLFLNTSLNFFGKQQLEIAILNLQEQIKLQNAVQTGICFYSYDPNACTQIQVAQNLEHLCTKLMRILRKYTRTA